jgi:PhzF family phenazine biosynthesis protein
MRELRLLQVDAFADTVFHGNPAAVCPLDAWLPDEVMQGIALENNLSETAFFVPEGDGYRLRWFTPRTEVDLCGHATLASAFVLFTVLDGAADPLRFETRSGRLEVSRQGDLLVMDFPSTPPEPCPEPPAALIEALRVPPREVVFAADDYFAVYENEAAVRDLRPDFALIESLGSRGLAATAPGDDTDFVSRYFAPAVGINEDPVTGSIHTTLTPFWARRLGKERLHGRQISQRGGDLFLELRGDRVGIAGRAVLYLDGTIIV